MKKVREYAIAYLAGAVGYSVIEILWRGFTHWTMAVTGGACFLAFHIVNTHHMKATRLYKCSIGCIMITIIEFWAGFVINKVFQLNVWDYSGYPFNLLGQICLLYSGLWFLLGLPMIYLSNRIQKKFANLELLKLFSVQMMKDQN